MSNYIFLGPPASGKGTQAKALAKKLGMVYFGTGDLMRQEAKKQTDFGKIFSEVWAKHQGGLVDNKNLIAFVKTKIDELGRNKSFVFDGYPRTIEQAEFLDKYLQEDLVVINIIISDDSVIARSSTRRICDNCGKIYFKPKPEKRTCDDCGGELVRRAEDAPEIVKKRLDVYRKLTEPLIDYYQKKDILINIDGEPPISEVEQAIKVKIDEKRTKNPN